MTNIFIPTRKQLEAVQPGDSLPNCFGKLAKVVEVMHRGLDIKGRYFICVRLQFSENSTITDSYKELELHRSTDLSREYNSHELDQLETKTVKEMIA